MKLPPHLQREFEIHLQKTPEKTRAVRKRLSEAVEAAGESPLSALPLFGDCERSLSGMLGIIQRKTTPLYVRLIHSAVSYFIACIQTDNPEGLEKAGTVIDSVAATIGREAYRMPRESA